MTDRLLAVSLVLVLAGCSRAAPVASDQPTPAGAPSNAPAASASVSATANGQGWQFLSGFPANGAAQLNAIATVGNTFVGVGTATNDNAACPADVNHGRVWASADGTNWTSRADDAFAQTDLTNVFTFGGAVYALGSSGTLAETTDCTSTPLPAGTNVWRSTDAGVTWQQLPASAGLARASVSAVITVGPGLLAVGSLIDADGNQHASTWTSSDGSTWSPAELPPDAPDLAVAAAKADVVVGFGDDQESPLAWISRDAGHHWYEESVEVPGIDISQVSISIEDVTGTESGFVAVGDACCVGDRQTVPIVLASADGTQWQGTVVPGQGAQQMRRIAHLPTGLLAVGIQNDVSAQGDVTALGGRSWLSADGKNWQAGPDFRELADGDITALTIGSAGVVVAGTAFVDEGSSDTGLRIWYAPFGALTATGSH